MTSISLARLLGAVLQYLKEWFYEDIVEGRREGYVSYTFAYFWLCTFTINRDLKSCTRPWFDFGMWFAYDPRMNSDHSLNLDHSLLHKTEQIDKASTTLLRIYDPSFTRTLKVPHKSLFVPIVQNRMKAKILAMRFAPVCRSAEKANKFRRGRRGVGGEDYQRNALSCNSLQ